MAYAAQHPVEFPARDHEYAKKNYLNCKHTI
jgi:hypothetical protein